MTFQERALLLFVASVIKDFTLNDEEQKIIENLMAAVVEGQPLKTEVINMKDLAKLATFYDRGKMAP